MYHRVLVAALLAMSASAASAAPLEAHMAKLDATVNELEFADKMKKLDEEYEAKKVQLEEEHGVKEQNAYENGTIQFEYGMAELQDKVRKFCLEEHSLKYRGKDRMAKYIQALGCDPNTRL